MKKYGLILWLALLIFNFEKVCFAADLISFDNEFIKIIVNNQEEEKGRFALETTGGSPKNKNDDFQPLIYGRPKPWTSYTTVLLDGKAHIFGGKTKRRAGKNGIFPDMVTQNVRENSIITTSQFGQVEVVQQLAFFRNPATQVKDAALISYKVVNHDQVAHEVGIRVMLDTMLGANDGAPFRIGEHAVEAEMQFLNKDILDYWQAFDNLATPSVIAQGTLRLPESNILPPDRLALVNWGTLADNPWEFDYQEGRSFIRAGELEKDTALALFWNPVKVLPNGGSFEVKTLFGLGGMNVAAGQLALGITAPSEIVRTSKDKILVVAYVFNSSEYDSKDTVVKFDLGQLKIVKGKSIYNLGVIPAGQARQIALEVVLDKPQAKKNVISCTIESETLQGNMVSRNINLLEPPQIEVKLRSSEQYVVSNNAYLQVDLLLKNNNAYSLHNVTAALSTDKNLRFPFFELAKKQVLELKPKQEKKLSWKLKVQNLNAGKFEIKALIQSLLTEAVTMSKVVTCVYPKFKMELQPSTENVSAGVYFYVALNLRHAQNMDLNDLNVVFNNEELKYIRTSPGIAFREGFTSANVQIEATNNIRLNALQNKGYALDKEVAKFHFKALKLGNSEVSLMQGDNIIDKKIINIIGNQEENIKER